MKLLMENWRQYKAQLINEAVPDQTLPYIPGKTDINSIKLDPGMAKKLLDAADNIRRVISIGEPTGIASWPDLISAISAFGKNQSLANAGELALAIVSVIPGAKYAAAPSKLGRLASTIPAARVTFGAVKPAVVKQSKELAARISDELATLPSGRQLSIDINKQLKNIPAAGRVVQALSPEEKYAPIDSTKKAEVERARRERRLGKIVGNCKDFLKFMGAGGLSSEKNRSPGDRSGSSDFGPLYAYFRDDHGNPNPTLTCKSLAMATKGGIGSKVPSQLFINSKPIKKLGEGAFGIAILLDNNHVVKFFIDGSDLAKKRGHKLVESVPELLEAYEKLYNGQFDGNAKPEDIAIYEYGTIPLDDTSPGWQRAGDLGKAIGYVEMGKVTVFQDWIDSNYLDQDRQQIWSFMDKLRHALIDAKPKSRIHSEGAVLKSFAEHAKENNLISGSDQAAEAYTDYVLNGDPKSTWERYKTAAELEKEQALQKARDRAGSAAARKKAAAELAKRQRPSYDPTTYRPPKRITQPETRPVNRADIPSEPLPDKYWKLWQYNTNIRWPGLLKSGLGVTMPYLTPNKDGIQGPIPRALRKNYIIRRPGTEERSIGEGYRFLRSFLKAIYRTASLNGDDYLYDRNTFDVHIENFGVAPRTVAADVDPSNPKAKKMVVDPQVIIFDR